MQAGMTTSDIRSFVAALQTVDPGALGDDELAERCLATSILIDVVLAHAAELAAEFDQRGTWADDGAASATAWIASRTGQERSELARRNKVGAALRRLPAIAAAARRGEISFDHVRRIVDCARRTPAFGAGDEALLLEHARTFNAEHFRAVAREWRSKAEDTADEDVPVEEPARREFLHLSQTFDGWWRLDGELDPANGPLVAALLDEHVDKAMRAQRDGDPALEKLPASSLRAEALVDLVAQHQRRDPCDHHTVPDRYRVAIVIRPDEFPMEACDSDLYRLVMTAEGEVLDIGRITREWTPPIRRAVTNRDKGCVFPGCDRPPSWCDIHHCREWEHGGPTCQDNGALLCRRHHTFVHRKNWRVVIPKPGGKPQVLQPDGTPFSIKPWRLAG